MLLLLQLLLRLLLVLDGGIEQLLGIVLAHLGLGLLLLLLIVLLVFLLVRLLLILLLVVLLLVVVASLLVLLLLILFLLLMLAEHEIVTGLVVLGIQTQGILVRLDGLTVHLVGLTDDTHVMVGLCLAQGIGLQTGCSLELLHSGRVLLLCHEGITQVEGCLRVLGVLLNRLTIGHLGIGIIA